MTPIESAPEGALEESHGGHFHVYNATDVRRIAPRSWAHFRVARINAISRFF